MRRTLRIAVAAAVCGGLLVAAFSCSKKPTKPPEKEGIRLYITEPSNGSLYAIDPSTDSLVDSIPGLYALGMLVSPDGRWMYFNDLPPAGRRALQKMDLRTLDIVTRREVGGRELALVDHGVTLLAASPLERVVEFIDPVSWQVVDSDSVALQMIRASDTASLVLAKGLHAQLACYDYRIPRIFAEGDLIPSDGGGGPVFELSLHPSGKFGYAIVIRPGGLGRFLAFDIPSFEVRLAHPLKSYQGYPAPSPDGRYVLITDPGSLPVPIIVGELHVYDVALNKVVKTVLTDSLTLLRDHGGGPVAVCQLAFSPDCSSAYVTAGLRGWTAGPVLVFDMNRLEFVGVVDTPLGRFGVTDLAVGPAP